MFLKSNIELFYLNYVMIYDHISDWFGWDSNAWSCQWSNIENIPTWYVDKMGSKLVSFIIIIIIIEWIGCTSLVNNLYWNFFETILLFFFIFKVLDSSIFAFWAKSSIDIEPRRIRLQSNNYTVNIILDTLTAASVQVGTTLFYFSVSCPCLTHMHQLIAL